MKSIRFLMLMTAMVVAQLSCRSRQQAPTQPADSATATAPAPVADRPAAPLTGRLTELGLTRSSQWRGLNVGDAFATVKATETGEAFERDARHVGYTVEFKNLETADMLYYQQNGRISAIDVDLFLNNHPSVQAFRQELEPYFTARYGTPKPAPAGLVWKGPAGEQVMLKDVSKGKDYGLKIQIGPAAGAATASAK